MLCLIIFTDGKETAPFLRGSGFFLIAKITRLEVHP